MFNTLQNFKHGKLHSLPALGKALNVKVERLPVSIRIVLESVLRNCDGKKVTEEHVRQLAANPGGLRVNCSAVKAPTAEANGADTNTTTSVIATTSTTRVNRTVPSTRCKSAAPSSGSPRFAMAKPIAAGSVWPCRRSEA